MLWHGILCCPFMLRIYCAVAIVLLFAQCNQPQTKTTTVSTEKHSTAQVYKAVNTAYYPLTGRDSIKNLSKYFPDAQQNILYALNRIDAANITRLDTVIVPADMSGSIIQYSPFPQSAPFLKDIDKIVFFSYPAQYFAAYENGTLVYSGPTNMGRQKDPTPTGLFYTNWKAEETKSTFNDEWDLKWNFNIQNKEGVGWHQYALPGYPASHSCLRMLEADAKFMYTWADQWVIKGTDDIQAYGTPVIVFGSYHFGSAKPWLQLLSQPHALDISADALQMQTRSYLPDIMEKQKQRISLAGKTAL